MIEKFYISCENLENIIKKIKTFVVGNPPPHLDKYKYSGTKLHLEMANI